MTDRLSLYNEALLLLEERKLASLTEAREPRYVLDTIWNNGAVKTCLEEGLWNHATRSMMIDYDPSYTAPFGYKYRFSKPSDYVRTAAICSDEYFRTGIKHYSDEGDYWYCDNETIYVQIISDGETYGGDLSKWPQSFCRFFEAYMAHRASFKIAKSKVDDMAKLVKPRKLEARNNDAMNQPVKFRPRGSWLRSRQGSGVIDGNNYDRG